MTLSHATTTHAETTSSFVLPPHASSVLLGRRTVMAYLDVLRDRYDVNTVLLLVTELLANAVDRSTVPFEFSMWVLDDRLHIETRDESSADKSLRPARVAEVDDQSRQLRMISALADTWGVELFLVEGQRSARVVWFEYVLTPRRRDAPAAVATRMG